MTDLDPIPLLLRTLLMWRIKMLTGKETKLKSDRSFPLFLLLPASPSFTFAREAQVPISRAQISMEKRRMMMGRCRDRS